MEIEESLGDFILPESSNPEVGYTRFWQYKLLRLIWDLELGTALAKSKNRISDNEEAFRDAKLFVRKRTRAFDDMCDFAGFEPDYVHDHLMGILKRVEEIRKSGMK